MSLNPQLCMLPDKLRIQVDACLEEWRAGDKVRRLWNRDASLWTNTDESKWLGWLDITEKQLADIDSFKRVAADVNKAKFKHALLLGMGGSSLCPEVLRLTFGKIKGFPELHVLDSTDPAQIKAIESAVDMKRTICIVSSKSGTTLEPNIYKQYFLEQIKKKVGAEQVGQHFIAITDPGSKMQQVAAADRFRHIFYGVASIGGRYSALSNFGIVPAAILGIDVKKFLKNAQEMMKACGPGSSADKNPGVVLGAILGTAANNSADKLTIISSPGIHDLGAWLEQLLAESTGKVGKGIIPVDGERVGKPEVYGNDRVFVYLRLASEPDKKQDAAVAALEKEGLPVVRINVRDVYTLGQEFFRWEMATAVAGSIIGINAFNQPDVEASKVETRKLTAEYEQTGKLPAESPFLQADGIKFFADEKNSAAFKNAKTLVDVMKVQLDRMNAGDYFGILAYITMNPENQKALEVPRHSVRDRKKAATVLGFGPRFLHSTGQAYKGGPDTGVFLQITCDDKIDLKVPGQDYTFSVVKAAQARGDFAVLAERGRRALRAHIGKNTTKDLAKLTKAIQEALESSSG